jgi:hypothetical protein
MTAIAKWFYMSCLGCGFFFQTILTCWKKIAAGWSFGRSPSPPVIISHIVNFAPALFLTPATEHIQFSPAPHNAAINLSGKILALLK